MARLYSLSARARRGRMSPFLRRLLVALLTLALPLYLIYSFQLYPGIARLSGAAAERKIEGLLATAFATEFAESADVYDELISIRYRADGGVASVSCRMQGLNRARNDLLLAVLRGLQQDGGVEVTLPLGNLLGGEAFSGRGPGIPVRVLLAPGASAYMESEFCSAGINQTLHRILFVVRVKLTVLTPTRPQDLTVCQSFPVAETLIVGDVPDAFTQVNRLTDDVTEIELDDINDYGASL